MEITEVNTGGDDTPLNSDFREHSRNLLESAAGEAQELVSEQRSVKQALDSELHSNASEYREHSQKSRNSERSIDVETLRNNVKQTFSRDSVHLQVTAKIENILKTRGDKAGRSDG